MLIDGLFILLMLMALVKGWRNGFVVAVFSLLAIVIGLAAAMKCSTIVAGWLESSTHIAAAWLPFLSFAAVMIAVIILVRLGAKMIQSAIELVLLGWLNKLSGILLYAVLYTTLFSVVLFYAEQLHLFKPATLAASRSYAFIQPWGPKAIQAIGTVIPWFRDMFHQLTAFFEKVPTPVN
jgi:membrane protein required for colicin V production